ncbi:MAG TPA: TylF/MycF family methyltransferase [Acidimicrobiales bacterium]|jgi:hypothetical protein|nr:TylF/MycF family methyltransferase [Acidimicrobiales bacterium]
MDRGVTLYLDLLKKTVTNVIYEDPPNPLTPVRAQDPTPPDPAAFDESRRRGGEDWPLTAHTMVGLQRLDNLQACVEQVLADDVPGDLLEAGVWRGGVCVFMRGLLAAHGVVDRTVWVADSFEGMPVAGEDSGGFDHRMRLHRYNDVLGVSRATVEGNFRRYDLLDEQVRFLPGWFADTLPTAPIDRLAVLRLDGDLYDSTMCTLDALYPKLAIGGYLIIDDYGLNTCRQAVEDYRAKHGIDDEIMTIDKFGAYWRRRHGGPLVGA